MKEAKSLVDEHLASKSIRDQLAKNNLSLKNSFDSIHENLKETHRLLDRSIFEVMTEPQKMFLLVLLKNREKQNL